jgi:hypothetical protein
MLQNQYFVSIIKSLYYDTPPALLFLDQNQINQLTLPQENPRPGKSPIAIACFINILLRILEILLH